MLVIEITFAVICCSHLESDILNYIFDLNNRFF